MRIVTAALLAAFAGFLLPEVGRAGADGAVGAQDRAGRNAAPIRRRSAAAPLRRVPIYRARASGEPDVYPRYNPGPNAVRDCTATYVQEYRPSGTVITPRMNCYWRPG